METLRLPWTELSYKARERRTRCAWHGWGPGATQRRKSRCVGNVAGEGRAQEHQVGLCGTAQRSGEAVTALTWFIDAQDRASTDARTDTEYFPPPPPFWKNGWSKGSDRDASCTSPGFLFQKRPPGFFVQEARPHSNRRPKSRDFVAGASWSNVRSRKAQGAHFSGHERAYDLQVYNVAFIIYDCIIGRSRLEDVLRVVSAHAQL